jgi:hypothetical protein
MQIALLTACLTVCAMRLQAQDLLSEVTGNWGGTDNDGDYFRAALTQNAETLRLQIWTAPDRTSIGGAPQFDNPEIGISELAVPGGQRLAVVQTVDGTTLQVIMHFADEAYEGKVVKDIQFLDKQFTVVGYHFHDVEYELAVERDATGELTTEFKVAFDCDADLLKGTTTVNGRTTDLPARDFESLNASAWTEATARDLDICPTLD